jgi:uncharacterized coiled-coil protein SlyX
VATTHAKQEALIRGLLATVRAHEAEIKRLRAILESAANTCARRPMCVPRGDQ